MSRNIEELSNEYMHNNPLPAVILADNALKLGGKKAQLWQLDIDTLFGKVHDLEGYYANLKDRVDDLEEDFDVLVSRIDGLEDDLEELQDTVGDIQAVINNLPSTYVTFQYLYENYHDANYLEANFQRLLTAGEGITIVDNVISSTGGGNVDDVKVNGVSVVTDKVANIDLTPYLTLVDASGLYLTKSNPTGTGYLMMNTTYTPGEDSASLGTANNVSGQGSLATGYGNTVSGNHNMVAGTSNMANGVQNVVGGDTNTVSGYKNVVVGSSNAVTRNSNLVVGEQNDVSNDNNIVGGAYNEVTGGYGLVAGAYNKAEADCSVALGDATTSSYQCQVAMGTLNVPTASTLEEFDITNTYAVGDRVYYVDSEDIMHYYACIRAIEEPKAFDIDDWAEVVFDPTTEAFMIGDGYFTYENGETVPHPHNAFSIDWDGNVKAEGEFYAKGNRKLIKEPVAHGTNGQVLATNGNGDYYWADDGGNVNDVKVNGASVVDLNKVANITVPTITVGTTDIGPGATLPAGSFYFVIEE